MKRISELLHASEILAAKLPLETPITSLSNDSKTALKGAAYFAIRGTKVDGHSFIATVLKQGVNAVIVEDRESFEKYPNTILVSNTRSILGKVASRWYGEPTKNLSLVGVTGTNGKTTSTYLLKSIWEKMGLTTGVIGTVENLIGNERYQTQLTTPGPLELQSLYSKMVEKKVSHAVMEVTSIALHQSRVAGCHFKVGLFTNLTQDHLDYHHSFENYYSAKKILFSEFPLEAGVFNIDDKWGQKLAIEATSREKITFALTLDADFKVLDAQFDKNQTKAKIKTPKGVFTLHSPLIGRHNLYNALGTLAVSFALDQDLSLAFEALATAKGAPGRLDCVMSGTEYPNVFVDYAHTDDALKNVLSLLADLRLRSPSRIITVFGCGGDRDRAKRPLMGKVASEYSDISIATSDNPRTEDPDQIINDIEPGIQKAKTEYHREVNRKKAIELALSMAEPQDLVLIAGKGHENYQIIGTSHFPFDDRLVVEGYFRQKNGQDLPR